MSDAEVIFGKALEESNLRQLKQASVELYQIYQELQKAGFDKQEAMTLMIALTRNGEKKIDENA